MWQNVFQRNLDITFTNVSGIFKRRWCKVYLIEALGDLKNWRVCIWIVISWNGNVIAHLILKIVLEDCIVFTYSPRPPLLQTRLLNNSIADYGQLEWNNGWREAQALSERYGRGTCFNRVWREVMSGETTQMWDPPLLKVQRHSSEKWNLISANKRSKAAKKHK